MKKLGIILLTAAVAVQAAAFSAAAEDGQISVRVTIGTDGAGAEERRPVRERRLVHDRRGAESNARAVL